ncbi:ATP-binding protein [Oleispirillum naphthae]|uniref:AAA family ATPase n=1 Tax=Oleispirillum naphthae TaxID=2838853 RepID=UPI0030825B38
MGNDLKIPHDVKGFVRVLMPSEAEQPILARPVREAVHQWMTELWATEELKAVGLKPRRSMILEGPPGCGKTTLAHHFSARLGLPLLCVQTDNMVGAHLGETGKNIAAAFSWLEERKDDAILFLDEFDAVATKRTEDNQACAREMNATVNSLLQRLEASQGIIIAATNRSEAIDPAVWRRFGMHLTIELPGDEERYAIISRYLAPYSVGIPMLDALTDALDGASPALLRQLMEGIKRDLILAPRLNRDLDLKATLLRLTVSVRPHPAYKLPPFYKSSAVIDRIAGMPWPPERKDAA